MAAPASPRTSSALKQLAGNTGYHFQLLTAVIEVNELQKRRVMKKLEKHLGSLAGKQVALLGLAFKPDTDDMREAIEPGARGAAPGRGRDGPRLRPRRRAAPRASCCPSVEFCGSAEEALEGADAAILVTEWPEFAELDWASLAERMATPLVIDGRNFLDPEQLREAGLRLRGHRAAGRRRTARRVTRPRRRPRGSRDALMQALILVGGEGTRLRPLTLTRPKPAMPLVDRPFIRYMVDWVAPPRGHDVVMACGFGADRCARRSARATGRALGSATSRSPSRWAPPGRCAWPPTRGCSATASWS